MKRGSLAVVVAIAATLNMGCYHTIVRGGPRSPMERESRTAFNTFWGMGSADVDLADCPAGLAEVRTWSPWWGFVPWLLSFGFFYAQQVEYVCAQAAAVKFYGSPPGINPARRR